MRFKKVSGQERSACLRNTLSSPLSRRWRATRVREARNCGVQKEYKYEAQEKNIGDDGISHPEEDRQFAAGEKRRACEAAEFLPDCRAWRRDRDVFHDVHLPALSLHRLELPTRRSEGEAGRGRLAEFFVETGNRPPERPQAHRHH